MHYDFDVLCLVVDIWNTECGYVMLNEHIYCTKAQ